MGDNVGRDEVVVVVCGMMKRMKGCRRSIRFPPWMDCEARERERERNAAERVRVVLRKACSALIWPRNLALGGGLGRCLVGDALEQALKDNNGDTTGRDARCGRPSYSASRQCLAAVLAIKRQWLELYVATRPLSVPFWLKRRYC